MSVPMRGEPTFAQQERVLLENIAAAARSYRFGHGEFAVLDEAIDRLDQFRADPRWTTSRQPDTVPPDALT